MWLSILTLLCLSAFGFKSLFIFCGRNGTLKALGGALEKGTTPSGQPLRPLVTGIGPLDIQIKAVAIFQLLFFENTRYLDASLVNEMFFGAWVSTWYPIILESLRVYSSLRFLSWTAIPGILVFNYSHAVISPWYFAIWLLLKPPVSREGLMVSDIDYLRVVPWTLYLGAIVPFILMSLPAKRIGKIDIKHTVTGWYQQWHLYISLLAFIIARFWPQEDFVATVYQVPSLLASSYQVVYLFTALTTWWLPLAVCLVATIWRKNSRLSFQNVWVPYSPFQEMQMKTIWDGAKCLLQWDGIVGTAATLVWAATLYLESRALVDDPEPAALVAKRLAKSVIFGGPVTLPMSLLYERDMMVLM